MPSPDLHFINSRGSTAIAGDADKTHPKLIIIAQIMACVMNFQSVSFNCCVLSTPSTFLPPDALARVIVVCAFIMCDELHSDKYANNVNSAEHTRSAWLELGGFAERKWCYYCARPYLLFTHLHNRCWFEITAKFTADRHQWKKKNSTATTMPTIPPQFRQKLRAIGIRLILRCV